MHALFRLALSGGDDRAYRDALEILAGAGFRRAGAPGPIDPRETFPAAVLAEVWRDPAEVTRAIFAALREAGLRPVAVTGCRVAERRTAARAAAA